MTHQIASQGRESLGGSVNDNDKQAALELQLESEREHSRALQKELNESKDKQMELKDVLASKEKQCQESIRRQRVDVQARNNENNVLKKTMQQSVQRVEGIVNELATSPVMLPLFPSIHKRSFTENVVYNVEAPLEERLAELELGKTNYLCSELQSFVDIACDFVKNSAAKLNATAKHFDELQSQAESLSHEKQRLMASVQELGVERQHMVQQAKENEDKLLEYQKSILGTNKELEEELHSCKLRNEQLQNKLDQCMLDLVRQQEASSSLHQALDKATSSGQELQIQNRALLEKINHLEVQLTSLQKENTSLGYRSDLVATLENQIGELKASFKAIKQEKVSEPVATQPKSNSLRSLFEHGTYLCRRI